MKKILFILLMVLTISVHASTNKVVNTTTIYDVNSPVVGNAPFTIMGLRYPIIDGTSNYVVTTDGLGHLTLQSQSSGVSGITNVVSTGTGTSIVSSVTSTIVKLKSLVPGSNITITDTGTNLTIAATSGGSGTLTNFLSNVPWLVGSGATAAATVSTNSTKIPINVNTDNNASGLTNFPINVVLSNITISTTAPLAGGGNLSANRILTFDGSQTFNASGATNISLTTSVVGKLPIANGGTGTNTTLLVGSWTNTGSFLSLVDVSAKGHIQSGDYLSIGTNAYARSSAFTDSIINYNPSNPTLIIQNTATNGNSALTFKDANSADVAGMGFENISSNLYFSLYPTGRRMSFNVDGFEEMYISNSLVRVQQVLQADYLAGDGQLITSIDAAVIFGSVPISHGGTGSTTTKLTGNYTNLGSFFITNSLFVSANINGNGSTITNLDASQLLSGSIPTARYGSEVVQTGVTLSVTGPITGGGNLSANRSFGFDGSQTFNASGATNISLTSSVVGKLPIANGGTGTNTTMLVGNWTNTGNFVVTGSLTANGASFITNHGRSVGASFSGSATNVGFTMYQPVAFNGTITGVQMITTNNSCTFILDIFKTNFSNFVLPSSSIIASAPPKLVLTNMYQDTTLTGWGTAVAIGDVFGFKVTGSTNCGWANITINCQESN